jgi:hypothetical protein
MTIAARFAAALDQVSDPELAGPELLPVRLTRACARTLGVDGAGMTLADGTQQIPLGASSPEADAAERLQFTAGDGPCTAARETRQPVFAVEEDLRRRWPLFHDLLTTSTSFRAVVGLPLQPALAGAGALDLYFRRSADVPGLDVFEAMAVGELIASALSDAAVWSTWSATQGPEWLQGPAPQRRSAVWEAMGLLGAGLGVSTPAALALLRGRAYAEGRSADEIAADVVSGRLRPADLEHGGTIPG